MKQAPPFLSGGYPLLGHALEFNKNRGALFLRGYEEKGKVFAVKLAHKKAAVLIGPELQTLVFKETDKALNMAKPMTFLKAMLGEVAFVADHETYLQQRPPMYEPFQRRKMAGYLDTMNRVVLRWLESLPEQGRLELTAEMNKLVQEVAGRAFAGDRFMELVGESFWNDYAVMGKALDPILPPNLPIPKFIRRNRARRRMVKQLQPILDERRANPSDHDDFLQDFITVPKANGAFMSDDEIIGMLIAILFAAHETTAGQSAWTLILLLQNPTYLAQVNEELAENFPYGSRVNASTMLKLKHLRWAVDETTRMRPSADLQIRITDEDLDVGDYRIPKGWLVMTAAEVSQFLPEIFHRPQVFDPLRFSPARNEHKKVRNSIIGFGGGVHKCAGMNFALHEMLTICAHFLQQFDLKLETPAPHIFRGLGANRPSETWISFKRRPIEKLVPKEVIEEAVAAGCPHMAKVVR